MQILNISLARIPSEKANTSQTLQMCAAFASQGLRVTLLYPRRVNTPAMNQIEHIFEYYGLRHSFELVQLPSVDLLWASNLLLQRFPRFNKALQNRIFPWLVSSYIQQVKKYMASVSPDLIFTRSYDGINMLAQNYPHLLPKTFYEAHNQNGFDGSHQAKNLRRIGGCVTTTHHLKDQLILRGLPAENILVAPAGVRLERFQNLPDKMAARVALQLPPDQKLICYVGHLYRWKGVQHLIASLRWLPDHCLVYIVGGHQADIDTLRAQLDPADAGRVIFSGYVPPDRVPGYLAAADILVMPTSGETEEGRYFTSPLKLLEYMAARRPIIASDLPSVRELLRHGENARLFSSDDPQSLAENIRWVTSHPEESAALAQQAWLDAQKMGWNQRAAQIIHFMQTRSAER